jgi:glycosyltransferase EpsF
MQNTNSGVLALFPDRILHVNAAMNLRGAESMVMNLYRNIDRSQYQLDFLYYTEEECYFDQEIKSLGGNIYRIKEPDKTNYLKFIKNIRGIIKSKGPFSAVHIHTQLNSGFVAYAAKKEKVPVVIAHSHSTKGGKKESLYFKIYEIIMKELIRKNSNRFIACSNEAGIYLFGEKIFSKKGVIIPNAINMEKYYNYNQQDILSLRSTLEINNDSIIIGQIGALTDVKNHMFSLEIAKNLNEKKINFCLLFIGDGDNRIKLEKKVAEYNLVKTVKFLGVRSDIPLLLNLIDVIIMPSLFEGLPVTLVEAQAIGVPAVISNNISSEADFNLGLIKKVGLDESLDNWVKEIISFSNSNAVFSYSEIEKVFSEKGYLIQQSLKIIYDLYQGKMVIQN